MSIQKSKFREYAESIITAFLIAMVIRTFVIQAFKIPTGSMEPTLHGDPRHGDRIFVNKFIYGARIPLTDKSLPKVRDPKRGDIVVFTTKGIPGLDPNKDYIKRLIGLPGDTVEIKNGEIYVNNEKVIQPEISKNKYFNSVTALQPLDIPKKGIKIPKTFFLIVDPVKDTYYMLNETIYRLPDGIKSGDKFTFDPKNIKYMEGVAPFQTEFLANGGQSVECRSDGLYIDKTKCRDVCNIKSLYVLLGQYGMAGHPITVPEGHYFVLGDNSNNSKDSRYWGFVPANNVKGEALFIWWPPKRWQVTH
jgi:signal peptidase I